VRYVRRPGLGFTIPVDPTAGQRGGAPITYPGYQCQIRYLADGTVQSNGTSVRHTMAGAPSCDLSSGWVDYDLSKPFNGLKKWVDGIEFQYNAVGGAGFMATPIGWNMTTDGQREFGARSAAQRASGSSADGSPYAPLPPGVEQTTPVDPRNVSDPVMMEYAIAKDAASQHAPSAIYRIYDPFTWKGYQALPDGFLEPQDGGVWVLASDNVLDAVQKQFGIMKDPWYWMVATHPTTGQLRLFLAARDPSRSTIWSKLGKTGPLVISILGTVLAPFTFGASSAVAAVVDTAIALEQKKAAAAAAVRAGDHQAAVMSQQVADQEGQVNQQADAVYQQNQTAFLAAGYTSDKWAALTLDQKTALIQQAAAGQLQPTPAAVAVAQQTQQALDQAVQDATVKAGLGVPSTQAATSSGGIGWLLAILGGGAALAVAGGKKR
jgi:hypothetical protein